MLCGPEAGGSANGITSRTLTDAHEQSARQTLTNVAGNRKGSFIVGTGRAPRVVAEAILTPTRRRVGKIATEFLEERKELHQ